MDLPGIKKRPKFVTEVVEETPQANYQESPFAAPQAPQTVEPTTSQDSPFAASQATQADGQAASPQPQIQPEFKNNDISFPEKKKRGINFSNIHHKHFLFLIPALILVLTIAVVGYITNRDFTLRVPEETEQVDNSEQSAFIPVPSAEPDTNTQTKILTFSNDSYTFKYPDTYIACETSDGVVNLAFKNEETPLADFECGSFKTISIEPLSFVPDYLENEELVATESANLDGQLATKYEIKASGSNTVYMPFTIDEQDYQFVLFDIKQRTDFLNLISSFKFVVDITKDWSSYENIIGYSLKYPEDWTVIEPEDVGEEQNRIEIRRDRSESRFQVLKIDSTKVDNAPISATQAVSSTRALAGWDESPTVELRNLGGADAQIIKGSFNGVWNVFAVIWYRNTVIQITWEDDSNKPYDQYIEQMLNSFLITI